MGAPAPVPRSAVIRSRQYWPQIAISLAVIGLTGRESSIIDSSGNLPPAGVILELPAGYIATSPVSRLLDALSVLSTAQSIALFLSVAVIVGVGLALSAAHSQSPTWKRVGVSAAALVLVIAIVEAAVVMAPRPMAALRAADAEIVRVDFHSHTGVSHDVRRSFTAERNREWHRSGGFDVAYISDHVTFGGVIAARPNNPARAGDGTSLLSAVEGRYHRIMSTIMLGVTEADSALLNRRGNLLPGTLASGRSPVTIVALPNRNLDSINVQMLDSLPNFTGIELVDAAPRGLAQFDRDEAKIRRIASELRLLLVAASNNHGWGRTVAAWNLVRIPGWRALSPDSVGFLIERQFLDRQRDAVTIIMRTRTRVHGAAVAATLPVLAYQVLASLTLAERVIWLVWIWGITALIVMGRRRHNRRKATSKDTEIG